jgi:hypothetical protein
MAAPLPRGARRGMVSTMSSTLYVLAASYDDVDAALADFEAIEAAYRHVGSSRDFDATVIAKDSRGEVEIVRRHDEAKRHAKASGAGWGIAAGAVAVLFPAVGILGALAVGGGTGAAIAAATGHASKGMTRDDLTTLGQVLDEGDAGLVVVYASEMAGHITTGVSRAKRSVRATTTLSAEALAAEMAP